ncbi:MAG: hypothetical protein KF729_23445 [Sandaracinaceae bacterium]|nr:hypothetical protein [Sandaracinaceae bacterium]
MRSDGELAAAVRDAADAIIEGTGASAWRHFEDGHFEGAECLAEVHRAIGLIEGAAVALGMTPLELLDDLGITDA